MEDHKVFIGLDVHKDTIAEAIAEGGPMGEVRLYGTVGGDLNSVEKLVGKFKRTGKQMRFVYEAGPCGYKIYRYLTAKGVDCAVVAPSMVPKRSTDRIKTDRRDAVSLARLHRAGELSSVYVPLKEDEAIRDLSRAREDAKYFGGRILGVASCNTTMCDCKTCPPLPMARNAPTGRSGI